MQSETGRRYPAADRATRPTGGPGDRSAPTGRSGPPATAVAAARPGGGPAPAGVYASGTYGSGAVAGAGGGARTPIEARAAAGGRAATEGRAAAGGRAAAVTVPAPTRGAGAGGPADGTGPERAGGKKPPTKTKGKTARPRRKDPLWARLVVVFGAILMLTSGLAVVGTKVIIGRYAGAVTQQNLLGSAKDSGDSGKTLDGALNFLLLGVDERASDPGNVRSDTIMIAHIPASHDQAYLLSVPRDTFVTIPKFTKSGYAGGQAKLTEAFYFGSQNGAGRAGGAELIALTLKKLLGMSFDGASIIDFSGFKKVIDAIGGVDMCVDVDKVTSIHLQLVDGKPMTVTEAKKVGGGKPVVYTRGCRHFEGWEALDYSRQRYGLPNSDYDRQRHQQQLIKAMVKGMMSKGVITNPIKLDKVIRAAGSAFILDTGGAKIEDFIFTLKGVAANDLVMLRTNGGKFNSTDVNGSSTEALNQESLDMFEAAKSDQMAQFVLEHPDWVAKEK